MNLQGVARGRVDYLPAYAAMQAFTAARDESTPDELWLCEHPPVFTQGLGGRPEHVRDPGGIPVVATNRGGQVTYHGPGQVVAYPLLDLRRRGYFVKEYVHRLEEAVIRTLGHFGVTGHRVRGAPGVYVNMADPHGHSSLPAMPFETLRANGIPVAKIAALGIKVSRHCTYHGVALNVDMDLEPFSRIDPCGYAGLDTIDLSRMGVSTSWDEAAALLAARLGTWLEP